MKWVEISFLPGPSNFLRFCWSPLHFKFNLAPFSVSLHHWASHGNPSWNKGHNFSSTFAYVGFDWDLTSLFCTPTWEKDLRLLDNYMCSSHKPSICLNRKMSHLSMAPSTHHSGLSTRSLPPTTPYPFLSKFLNPHILHHIPSNVMTWLEVVVLYPRDPTQLPSLKLSLSSHWYLGWCLHFCGCWGLVDSHWAAWQLLEAGTQDSQDIGWAESSCNQAGSMWLTSSGFHNTCFKINCTTHQSFTPSGKGHSCNPCHNEPSWDFLLCSQLQT